MSTGKATKTFEVDHIVTAVMLSLFFAGVVSAVIHLNAKTREYDERLVQVEAYTLLNQSAQLLVANELHRVKHDDFASSTE